MTTIEVISNVQQRTFGQNTYYSQEIAVHKEGSKYPDKATLNIQNENSAYPQGKYELDVARSTGTDQYGSLSLVRYPKLIPVKQ